MTAPAPTAEWELVAPDGRPLGRLTQDGSDGPWRLCRYAPTPDFAPIAELFAEDVGLLEEDEMDAWEMVHERIASLRLQLRPAAGGEPIRKFALHVDGDRAWFRSS